MEKRRSRRFNLNLKAERLSGNGQHSVFIENISEHGILIIVPHSPDTKKFNCGMDVDLNIQLKSGGVISLACQVRWLYLKTPPEGLTDSIGLEIANPPEPYRQFVRSLH
jgi:hypothetical protein